MSEPLPPEPRAAAFHPWSWWLFGNAWWQLSEHQYAAGVLLAQASVEMGARFAFTTLLVLRYGPLDDDMERELGPPDYSFMNEDTRRLWTDLAGGDSVTTPKPTWKAYHHHVEFRNRIAHGDSWGDSNGGRDARASVLAVHAFMRRLSETMVRFEGKLD